MSKNISSGQVNAVYGTALYLNVGKPLSLKVPATSFKEVPEQGDVVTFECTGKFQLGRDPKSGACAKTLSARDFKVVAVKSNGWSEYEDYDEADAPAEAGYSDEVAF